MFYISLILLNFWASLSILFGSKDLSGEWNYFNESLMVFQGILSMSDIYIYFLLSVVLISSSIFFFIYDYMGEPSDIPRFLKLTYMFMVSMLLILICPHFFSIILGWDGLGLSSYLLIIFYSNDSSISSGNLTIFISRMGDVCFMVVLSLVVKSSFGNLNFSFTEKFGWGINLSLSLVVFFLGSTKSPQIPIHSWLLAAMSAPTPISALVHSSTLVTAGLFLFFLTSSMMDSISSWEEMNWFVFLAGLTCMFSSLSAVFQIDFKKIIALSTLSHVSLMVLSFFCQMGNIVFLHLLVHSFFKAGVFMIAGYIMQNQKGFQDTRLIPQSFELVPGVISVFLVFFFNLLAMFFSVSFFSKEKLIFLGGTSVSLLSGALIFCASFLSGGYSIYMLMNLSSSKSFMPALSLKKEEWAPLKSLSFLLIFLNFGVISFWPNIWEASGGLTSSILHSLEFFVGLNLFLFLSLNKVASFSLKYFPVNFMKLSSFFFLSKGAPSISWAYFDLLSKNFFESSSFSWADFFFFFSFLGFSQSSMVAFVHYKEFSANIKGSVFCMGAFLSLAIWASF